MVTIKHESHKDWAAREALLDRVFGAARFLKTCEALRKGRLPSPGLSFGAFAEAELVGTVRLWDIVAGTAGPALLLGPLAVKPELQGRGIGAELVRHAVHEATLSGHGAILLVGDGPYYRRFGFSANKAKGLLMPGPVEKARFQALELEKGALAGAKGPVYASGRVVAADERRSQAWLGFKPRYGGSGNLLWPRPIPKWRGGGGRREIQKASRQDR